MGRGADYANFPAGARTFAVPAQNILETGLPFYHGQDLGEIRVQGPGVPISGSTLIGLLPMVWDVLTPEQRQDLNHALSQGMHAAGDWLVEHYHQLPPPFYFQQFGP